jgi:hypothetical protein
VTIHIGEQKRDVFRFAPRAAVGSALFALALAAWGQGTATPGPDTSAAANATGSAAQSAVAAPSHRARSHHKDHKAVHHKAARHTAKSRGQQQAGMQGDQAYRRALKACAMQVDPQRDRCLDNAIEQFGRNT